ncbi:hypothetical protein QMZ92_22825 [Streptomyces sp. HNM0645]|uniref:hypothetical protein n=1 Tax=Streptomyces sp. HNM0645 TaxID=2782343 RepID=UPI0024B6717B|nr:hypothetical protein [Streptomyces sp. HNM0645]MDI9887124.1 hypothetical protein [Streptomyces sp. HNM0645]
MNPDASRRPRMQQVTTTGSALAAALLPLMVGILVAKSLGADPMSPVNALIAGGGRRPQVCPAQLRSCGRSALRRGRPRDRTDPREGAEHGACPELDTGPDPAQARGAGKGRVWRKVRRRGRPVPGSGSGNGSGGAPR